MAMQKGENVRTFSDLVEPTLYYSVAWVKAQSLYLTFNPNFNQIP